MTLRLREILLLVLASAITLTATRDAQAHSFSPVAIRIVEVSVDDIRVSVRASIEDIQLPPVEVTLPEDCAQNGEPSVNRAELEVIRTYRFRCERSLAGRTIVLPEANTARRHLVLHASIAGQGDVRRLLQRGEEEILLEPSDEDEALYGVGAYLWIGVEHIWFGMDHLLFVLCLVLLIRDRRKLFWTVTAFTLAHSLTLGLSALGSLSVPGPPVEATIALSVMLLAVEAVRYEAGIDSLTSRSPWLIALLFGLIHGLGFAGALSDIGLPETQEVPALALFNVGVELGQIAFVIALMALAFVITKLRAKLLSPARLAAAWLSGVVAAYWVVDRIAGFFVG